MKTFPFLTFLFISLNTSADYWIRKADLPVNRGRAVSFVIGGKGYVGTGDDGWSMTKDFWAYDPNSDSWTQVADLPGPERMYGFAFAIGTKGYVGGGITNSGDGKDFYEYNASLNTWNQKGDLPYSIYDAVAFSIGTKGYLGTGLSPIAGADFWEYDPAMDTWTRKADFAGGDRCRAFGFSINGKGYVGGGNDSTTALRKDFYEYDPISDTWISRADYAGHPISWTCSFELDGFGYVYAGFDSIIPTNHFWKYDPLTNQWIQKTDFIGKPVGRSCAFSINNRGYICAGDTLITGGGSAFSTNTHWEYVPDSLDAIDELLISDGNIEIRMEDHQLIIFSKHEIDISIFGSDGKLIRKNILCRDKSTIDISTISSGVYFLTAEGDQNSFVHKFMIR